MRQHREVLPTQLQPLIVAEAPEPRLVDAYWVVPGRFLAGPYPGGYGGHRAAKEAVEELLGVGVTVFLDLTEADEVASYAHHLIGQARHVRLAIPDFDTPSASRMTEILDEIDRAVQQDQVVYLHCSAGLGRTGTVVGCYLVRSWPSRSVT